MKVYQREIHRNLPQLFALFDFDHSAENYGLGDRFHWAWGLIDFANGTFQNAANGLAELVGHDLLLPGSYAERMAKKIGAIFEGTRRINRPNGNLEGAFPFERSFCVTALDAGVVVEGRDDGKGSRQGIQYVGRLVGEESRETIEADFLPILRRRAAPIPLLGLRVLSMTIMRWSLIREWIKQLMAWLLISRVGARMGTNRRRIQLGPKFATEGETRCEAGFEVATDPGSLVAIHKASQGYWQFQDEEAKG